MAQMLEYSVFEISIVPATIALEERVQVISKVSETKTCQGLSDDIFPAST